MGDGSERSGEVLEGRFEIASRLGRGAQGVTYAGIDRETGADVVIKELDVGRVASWKAIELFEREGEALASLDHPNIPDYVDAFHVERDGEQRFYLVQERVWGEPLDAWIERGQRVNEEGARDMARQLFEIARYIHGLIPPIVHRDIKPSNLIRGEDGRLWLVDFGAVQALVPESTGGSTVVGTTGYMPVEQLMGRATGAADLYAIGATLVHVLSHTHPAEMEVEFMRLKFEERVRVSPGFEALLRGVLEPHVENRIPTAEEALRRLDRCGAGGGVAVEGPASASAGPDDGGRSGGVFAGASEVLGEIAELANAHQRSLSTWQGPLYDGTAPELPEVTALRVSREPGRVELMIPRIGWSKSPAAGFAVIWNVVVGLMTAVMVAAGETSPVFFLFLSLFIAVGVAFAVHAARTALTSHELTMTPDTLDVRTKGVVVHKRVELVRAEVDSVDFRPTASVNNESIWEVSMKTSKGTHGFLNAAPRRDQLFVASTLRDWSRGELFRGDVGETSFDFSATDGASNATSVRREPVEEQGQNHW